MVTGFSHRIPFAFVLLFDVKLATLLVLVPLTIGVRAVVVIPNIPSALATGHAAGIVGVRIAWAWWGGQGMINLAGAILVGTLICFLFGFTLSL